MPSQPRGRFTRTSLALGSALMLSISTPYAWAGPDDHRHVATEAHVDSPKAFWDPDTNNFTFKTEYGGTLRPIEESVHWIGKGQGQPQQFVYTVDGRMHSEVLGKPGDLLYWAPALVSGNYPIWVGYGADTSIPAENFKDGEFTLDIVGFEGPGRMELFGDSGGEGGINRVWSSHDPGLRSTSIAPGNHTHINTTFTKPGRYVVHYRATARDKQGNLIASAPQALSWQVGGRKPSPQGIGEVTEAYNKAPSSTTGSASFNPTFSIRPHKAEGDITPGAQYLTDLEFSTGNPQDSGTAVFYIDGYYLTEVPVSGGSASWAEMIGSYSSQFQVVYIPDNDQGSPRWVSAPLNYDRNQPGASISETATEFPTPATQDPPPAFDLSDKIIEDRGVTVTSEPVDAENRTFKISVIPNDPRLTLRVDGGFYAINDRTGKPYPNPDCSVQFTSSPSQRTAIRSDEVCSPKDTVLILKAIPDSLSSAGAGVVQPVLEKRLSEAAFSTTFELSEAPFVPQDGSPAITPSAPALSPSEATTSTAASTAPSTTSSSIAPPPPAPDTQALEPVEVLREKVELDRGHIDLGPVPTENGLEFVLNDDTRSIVKEHVARDPESVTMIVDPYFKTPLPDNVENTPYAFMGNSGDSVWLVSQVQRDNRLWPGFSTEHVGGKAFNIEIEPVSAPEGAKWWAYTQGLMGIAERLASYETKTTIIRDTPIHLHNNWVFTKPGTYVMRMRAIEHGNPENATEPKLITFEVRDRAPEVEPESSTETTPAPLPETTSEHSSEAPQPEPQPEPSSDPEPTDTPETSTTPSTPTTSDTTRTSESPVVSDEPSPSTSETTTAEATTTTEETSTPASETEVPETEVPNPSGSSTPSTSPTSAPHADELDPRVAEKVWIREGHADIGPMVNEQERSLSNPEIMVGHDDASYPGGHRHFLADNTVFVVEEHFKHTLTEDTAKAMPYHAHAGDVVYLLPQTQEGNSLWPGFSTQHTGDGKAYDITIVPKELPQGAQWWAYTQGALGGVGQVLAGSDGSHVIANSEPMHLHANWLFTKPGIYTMDVSANEHDNPDNTVVARTVTFLVDSDGKVSSIGTEAPSTAPGAPAPSTTQPASSKAPGAPLSSSSAAPAPGAPSSPGAPKAPNAQAGTGAKSGILAATGANAGWMIALALLAMGLGLGTFGYKRMKEA